MSRYDVFRRRIAPIALVVAIALLARESCAKSERAHATLVLDFGVAERDVRAVDVEVWAGGDRLVVFHRVPPDGVHIGVAKFPTPLPARDLELRIDVELATSATPVRVTKHVQVDDGAAVTIRLAPDLVGPRAP